MEKQRESIGEVLKHLRKERQLTQKMLAADICAQSVISRVENNEELPNVIVLHQICERLNITVDQLMLTLPKNTSPMDTHFQGIYNHFIQRNYVEVAKLLEAPKLLETLYLETDLQLYYYYLGSCEFFVEKNYAAAIQSLRKGFSYTYNQDKILVSTIEIQMMSCLGQVLKVSGQREKALKKLEKSYQFVEKLPLERKTFELIKVYYHYGEILYEEKKNQEALKVVSRGLLLVQQFCSYYYLEELYYLKGLILKKLAHENEAADYFSLAKRLKGISMVKSVEHLDFKKE